MKVIVLWTGRKPPAYRYACTTRVDGEEWSVVLDNSNSLRFLVPEAPRVPSGTRLELLEGATVVGFATVF